MHTLILGTRGVPSQHGGFETFAQDLSLYLTARNHQVTVYCQCDLNTPAHEDVWQGVRRVFIPAGEGALGTVQFDWATVRHAAREKGVVLTLGYNTGVFNYLLRWRGMATVMNMDGIEWKRKKWSPMHRAWLWLNEIAGAHASDHLVADHPEISTHLQWHSAASKITVIPYGARLAHVDSPSAIGRFGVDPKNYFLVVARAEPDNSILDIVQAYSARPRKSPLVILGKYVPESSAYHREIMKTAGPSVKFVGAVYDREIVQSLRYHAKAYIHGHQVGGTNPSLVESLAAGNAIIAHDNQFTRWVAGSAAKYFRDAQHLSLIFDSLETDSSLLQAMEQGSATRHKELFEMDRVLAAYEMLLRSCSKRGALVKVPGTFAVTSLGGLGILDANHWLFRKTEENSPRRQRAAPRQKLKLPIVYHWSEGGMGFTESGLTGDISSKGVLIYGAKVPPVGSELRIQAFSPSPSEDEGGVRTDFFGRVTRIVEQGDEKGFGVRGVLHFERLTQRVLHGARIPLTEISPQTVTPLAGQ